ncbi:MAG: TraR/DksA C4-type zinc finger protein, partial [Burkholderiales bacterium]|nr:TraR/DksA C4-type zinc finger protein [Burkholderiales bacterium]
RRLHERLRARQRELRETIRAHFADHDDPGTMALRNRLEDTDDWAVADAMSGLDIAIASHDLGDLRDVDAALKRVADGAYGRCTDCDAAIPVARLDAYPTAKRCIRCQEAVERSRAQRLRQ